MGLLGFFAASLNIAWSDPDVNLLGRPLLGRLSLYVNTHLNTPDHYTAKTSAFIDMLTPADNSLIRCI